MLSVAHVHKLYALQHSSQKIATNRNAHPKRKTAASIYPTEPPKK